MMENRVLWGYEGEARGRGESEGLSYCLTRQGCPSILADVDVIKYQFHDMMAWSRQIYGFHIETDLGYTLIPQFLLLYSFGL
jgi:hypothetical protein